MAASRLPGPRANLELMNSVVDRSTENQFLAWLDQYGDTTDANSPRTFLAITGAVGLGSLLECGNRKYLPRLRVCCLSPNWRIRESVVLALERWGKKDRASLLVEMTEWCKGGLLEQRAAVAALSHPQILGEDEFTRQVLDLMDTVTSCLVGESERRSEPFRVLRLALGYCWSVAVAAYPQAGKPLFEKWCSSTDKDIRWMVKENLKKNRLVKADAAWVSACLSKL